MRCWEGEHAAFAPFAALALGVYGLGTPAAFAAVFERHWFAIRRDQVRARGARVGRWSRAEPPPRLHALIEKAFLEPISFDFLLFLFGLTGSV